jgi:hypothetical protein
MNIASKQKDVLEERKKICRKRIVFEANVHLADVIDSLNTFGRINVKELKDDKPDHINGVIDQTDIGNDTRNDVKQTSTVQVDGRNASPAGKTDINEKNRGKDVDMFKETDPFAVLRSLRKVELGDDFISGRRNVCGKGSLNGNGRSLIDSKHVKFVDDVSDKDIISRHDMDMSNLKQRGRIVTGYDKKRRARSASPRRSQFNSNARREKLQGILKNATKTENGDIHYQHLTDTAGSSYIPTDFQAMNTPTNEACEQNLFYNEKFSGPTNFQVDCRNKMRNKSPFNKSDKCLYEEKIGTRYIDGDSDSAENNSKYQYNELETEHYSQPLLFTTVAEKRKRYRNDRKEVGNGQSLTSNASTDTEACFKTEANTLDSVTKTKQKSTPRLRLPSFDEMLYIKD